MSERAIKMPRYDGAPDDLREMRRADAVTRATVERLFTMMTIAAMYDGASDFHASCRERDSASAAEPRRLSTPAVMRPRDGC